MTSFTMALALLLQPVLSPVSRWLLSRSRPTWQYEAAFVALVLVATAWFTTAWPEETSFAALRPTLINWAAASGVLLSFLQAQVGFRMAEEQQTAAAPSVHCHAWSTRYWVSKEINWLVVYLLSGAFAAIAGNVVFLLYPAWRQIHMMTRQDVEKNTSPG